MLCYILYKTHTNVLILVFILTEISGINNGAGHSHTHTYTFLCVHVGTKESDKKHKIWGGVISSIQEAWNQSVLGMNRQITFTMLLPIVQSI